MRSRYEETSGVCAAGTRGANLWETRVSSSCSMLWYKVVQHKTSAKLQSYPALAAASAVASSSEISESRMANGLCQREAFSTDARAGGRAFLCYACPYPVCLQYEQLHPYPRPAPPITIANGTYPRGIRASNIVAISRFQHGPMAPWRLHELITATPRVACSKT